MTLVDFSSKNNQPCAVKISNWQNKAIVADTKDGSTARRFGTVRLNFC